MPRASHESFDVCLNCGGVELTVGSQGVRDGACQPLHFGGVVLAWRVMQRSHEAVRRIPPLVKRALDELGPRHGAGDGWNLKERLGADAVFVG